MLPYGTDDNLRATKMYVAPGRGGEFLGDDELKVYEYVRWLEGERERLTASASAWEQQFKDVDALAAKLQAFKDYVHKRLDDAGVPADPESPHKAEGCRIGGRLDALLADLAAVRAELAAEVAVGRALSADLDAATRPEIPLDDAVPVARPLAVEDPAPGPTRKPPASTKGKK